VILALAANFLIAVAASRAQTPAPAANATATLTKISADGLKSLPESAVVLLTGLTIGSQVGRADLQSGADRLLQTGLFATV